jgi:predicted Fe-Mo cluster-binding NifX family protein
MEGAAKFDAEVMMRHTLGMCIILAVLSVPCVSFEGYGAEPLLIAVACDDPQATATSLVGVFAARSRHYLIFSGITMVEVLLNPFLEKGPEAGPLVVDYLSQRGVDVLIAGMFGPRMIDAMNEKGMKYFQYSGVAQDAVERVVSGNTLRLSKTEGSQDTRPRRAF